jgi:PAS domain S-box-containing protein
MQKSAGIQRRALTAILGTALLAFVLVGLGAVFFQASSLNARVHQFLTSYAEVVTVSTAVAVDFEDADRAQEILDSLKANPQFLRADILLADGSTLATYPAGSRPLEKSAWGRPDGIYFSAAAAELVQTLPGNGGRGAAHLFIRMSLQQVRQRNALALAQLALAGAGVLLVIGLAQFFLLRQSVLAPLARFAAAAEQARRQGDYTQRMPAQGDDEFAQLGKSFNALLATVEYRESALRRITHFQSAILNDAAYAIVSTTTEGCITSFNPAAERLLGYLAEELIGRCTPMIYHDADEVAARARQFTGQLGEPVAAGFATLVALSRRNLPNEHEWIYLRKDGRRVPVLLSVTALRDDAGEVIGFLGMAVDISESKQFEQKLRQNNSLLEATLQATADGILVVAADGTITGHNRQLGDIWRVPPEILAAREAGGLAEYLRRQLRDPAAAQRLAHFNDTSRADTFEILEFADGRIFERYSRPQFVEDKVVGRVWCFRDVTAARQSELALREAEELYRTLVNTSPDGITVLDLEGRVQFSSPRTLELFQLAAGDDGPARLALDFVAPGERERAQDLLRQAVAGKIKAAERFIMSRTDGSQFVAELNGALLRDGLGVPRGLMVITRDVTERQRQEDELKSKNIELERFTYTVSHDLKSPLITIKGFAGALLADHAAGRTDRLADDLRRIILATDKMAELLNGLLQLSRIGRIVDPPVKVSMAKIAADVVELLSGSIQQRAAKITVQPGLPAAYGDPQRLREVLQNLVENALKFSRPGHVPEIEIGCKTVLDEAVFFVRDHGQGIEARYHEIIFGLFNKLDTRSEGTGIGLALVRRIVEFHGGVIWVESAGAGQGATFCFTLPSHTALSALLTDKKL